MQICAKDLCLGYGNEIIVDRLCFDIGGGSFVAVVGENGSGKTTLIKTLAGIIPAISGEIKISGGIGYLPQDDGFFKAFPATVTEIVRSGLISKPFYSKEQKKKARDIMDRLGILPLAKKSFGKLSGGQKKRVLLARALCTQAEILLLDEPAAALDPEATADMYKILDEINKNDGMTVVMISHDIPSALSLATHVLHIGKTVFFGTAYEYKSSGLAGGGEK